MYVAKTLALRALLGRVRVTLISRSEHFLFTPLLHEVATGSLNEKGIMEPLEAPLRRRGVRFLQGEVERIDVKERRVLVGGKSLSYEYLVVATGSENNFYDIPGAEAHTIPLKTSQDAVRIRAVLVEQFSRAEAAQNQEERGRLLSVAVVGAGATGVELAAEVSELGKAILHRPAEVTLIGAEPEPLMMFHNVLRDRARRYLESAGIRLRLGATVTAIREGELEFADHSTVRAGTILWAAGVRAHLPRFEGAPLELIHGRARVDDYLRLSQAPEIFVIGDAAAFLPSGHAKPLPMLAQVAVEQARLAARNILADLAGKPLRKFHYHSKGTLISLGQWHAIGEVFSFSLTGPVAWWVWRTVYLFKTLSWRRRARIAFEWTVDIFRGRHIHKNG